MLNILHKVHTPNSRSGTTHDVFWRPRNRTERLQDTSEREWTIVLTDSSRKIATRLLQTLHEKMKANSESRKLAGSDPQQKPGSAHHQKCISKERKAP
ncbi:hypothetical protein M413DRAFT_448460 [Hebeloma cylindrosporum]|uniref:Uncharacterized protein n=1 Tax=Hebeloma cylindrosporum TaxID=76867 RepID=A0A0C3BZD2_HEBCY|nr:hypothetical protein M413DRAFT_448460 [Hebeloma cylindrosporum h7]